jgi:transcription initiation factor TFIIIB Brf1 subunit/transcription initiation factor TFIIB
MPLTAILQKEIACMPAEDQCCENPRIFLADTGEWVCHNCGTCKEIEIITSSAERRAYSEEDREKRYHAAPLSDNMDLWGFNHWHNKDATLYHRMARLQLQAASTRWRSRVFKDIKSRCSDYGLSKEACMLAFTIACKTSAMKFIRGSSMDLMIRSAVYFAARVHGRATTMQDFGVHAGERKRNGVFCRMQSVVLPELGVKLPPVQFKTLLHARVVAAGIPVAAGVAAFKRWNTIKAIEPAFGSGKAPDGIIAALLYHELDDRGLLGYEKNGKWTERMVAEACHVTEVTLRTMARKIRAVLGEKEKQPYVWVKTKALKPTIVKKRRVLDLDAGLVIEEIV